MITEQQKARILTFLPVMKELEATGFNPVEIMFKPGLPTINKIKAVYVAISKAKVKYPDWYKEVSKHLRLI